MSVLKCTGLSVCESNLCIKQAGLRRGGRGGGVGSSRVYVSVSVL